MFPMVDYAKGMTVKSFKYDKYGLFEHLHCLYFRICSVCILPNDFVPYSIEVKC